MIAGTTFSFGSLDHIWPSIQHRAKHIDPADLDETMQDVRTGKACCLSGPDGVVIFEIGPDSLFVRLAVSSGLAGAFKRQEEAMCAIARDIGVAKLAFRASRRGWARMLGAQWHPLGDDGFWRVA